ncbi:Nramp family divalent metal transporter [Glaciecola sp. HTCC2999]|jgi:NRAMP (natural resistance-associated macrophage protein)-like metal ion transporter|uniref:Nramp family divalent metal transporter n=1 Tax=Glaciecola sp. HTCC2999 TaxID=455436 RepID=UPI0000E0E580|nr:Nramp family divalent metal transporter [Glaciecola sp. HTCC2999]
MSSSRSRYSGLLVTAAFIGPGTVTTATLAGAQFGYGLLWALVFSIVATIIIQDMASRVGIVAQMGLSEALHKTISQPLLKLFMILLVVSAIGIGNAAYEAGNITGAALGLASVTTVELPIWISLIAIIAGIAILSGNLWFIERLLMTLVLLMSIVFIIAFSFSQPQLGLLVKGMTNIRINADNITMVIALIGTTIVPYNIFMQSSLLAKGGSQHHLLPQIKEQRLKNVFSFSLGGLITIAIIGTAASTFFVQGLSVDTSNLALQLQPLLGDYATLFFAAGLFAAGLTSAITAPIAGAYAVCGALQSHTTPQDNSFKVVASIILISGIVVALSGIKPIAAIIFAQATNALLLPIIAIFLLIVVNNKRIMRQHTNSMISNMLSMLIVTLVLGLGSYKLWML